MKFSLIYPTRDRPHFIKMALNFLERQDFHDFEVIVSDNYSIKSLSCEEHCRSANIKEIKYVHPSQELGMVENWNYALKFATGDYICYFTDKMFLLPGTLRRAANALSSNPVDIVTWVDNKFTPLTYLDYFGQGNYTLTKSTVSKSNDFECFDPREALDRKGAAMVARNRQTASEYARGKICFGAYSNNLIKKIEHKSDKLFHNISPDYTSMVLGCTTASTAMELQNSGIVHLNTDLSNGGKTEYSDDLALAYICSLENSSQIQGGYLVPGLYSSVHNAVTHDYLSLKERFSLNFSFDKINWLVHITNDIESPKRKWSSTLVESQHRTLLLSFIKKNLSFSELETYKNKLQDSMLKDSKASHTSGLLMTAFKRTISPLLPKPLLNMTRRRRGYNNTELSSITDILNP